MKDIMQQIQQLTEDFMNLIEVEGLGQPASDVPPSTNKIKRDIKTKNGKVELVSVEDELFPKDGDKREQLRQKVIDTINGMIQGTATLEDLLQIVRQKKVKPVKEALELTEAIINEIAERTKIDAYKKRVKQHLDRAEHDRKLANEFAEMGGYDHAIDYLKDADKSQKKEYKHRLRTMTHDKKFGQDAYNKAQKELFDEWKANKNKKIEEAFELLETALTAIRNSGLPKEKQQELTSKLAKGRAKERELADEKAFQSWAKGDRKQLDVQTVRDPEFTKNASGERKTRLRSHSNNYTKSGGRKIKPDWKQVEDSIKRHEKKTANENLEDQIEKKFKKGEISLDKAFELAKKIETKMSKEKNAQEYSDELDKRAKKEGTDPKILGKAIKRNENKNARTFESVEEILVESGALIDSVIKAHKEGKISGEKMGELIKKADKIPSDASYFHYPKEKKGEMKTTTRSRNYRRFTDDWKLPKTDQEKIEGSIKRKGKKDKSFPVFQALRAVKEASEITESIINEVSIGTLARAVANNSKRIKDNAKKSEEGAKKAWASYDKLSAEHPEDEPALYKAATELGKVAYKDDKKKEHVEDLERLNLPKDSKVSANKFFKAADKSYDDRAKEYDKLLDSGESRGKSYKETKESRPAKRYTRAARIAYADPVKSRNKTLDEAMGILEDVLSAINKSKKTEEEKDKLYDKVRKAAGTEMKDSELRKARDPRFKSSNVEARYWTKRDHDDGREQKKREEDKKFEMNKHGRPIYTRNGEIVPFSEAMVILEEIINELSPETVTRALDKRNEQSMQADEKDKKDFNNILKMKDKEKRVKAFQDLLHRGDKRFHKEGKRLDLYANYAKRHPEIVKEAIEILENTIFKKDPGRGDLLDDISTTLTTRTVGQNVKKVAQGLTKKIDRKKCSENFDKNEEKEYNECRALQLWEQVINEIEDRFFRILIPQNHKHEVVNSKFEDKVVKRVEDEYRNSKKKKGN